MMMCWGHISPQTAEHACLLLREDLQRAKAGTLDTALIEAVAKAGSSGQHWNLVSRDMLKVCFVLGSISCLRALVVLEQYSCLRALVVLAH